MPRRESQFLIAGLSLFLFPVASWGQTDTGTITGAVRDASSALVARVKISITDARTNTDVFSTLTDATGRYTAPALKPASTSSRRKRRVSRKECGGASTWM
jgi:Carboxypeptidase regulatory-like domain